MVKTNVNAHVSSREKVRIWSFALVMAFVACMFCLAFSTPATAFAEEIDGNVASDASSATVTEEVIAPEEDLIVADEEQDSPALLDSENETAATEEPAVESDVEGDGQTETPANDEPATDSPEDAVVTSDDPAASDAANEEATDQSGETPEQVDVSALAVETTDSIGAAAEEPFVAQPAVTQPAPLSVAAAAVAEEPTPLFISSATITYDPKVVVQGSSTPASNIVVTMDGVTLKEGVDYTVSYKNNTGVGTATLIITGIGKYSSAVRKTFEIVGAPSYTKGATKMPLKATSAWKFTNVTWKASNTNVTLSGKTVRGNKVGTSYIYLYDLTGKRILSQKITVYALNGAYVLNSYVGGKKVLDIEGARKDNDANVQIYTKNGTQAQTFLFSRHGNNYEIVNANSKMAVDVEGGSTGNSANIHQWERNGTNAQLWRITVDANNRLTFINIGSGKALDVAGGVNANGVNVHQYASNGTLAQKWNLTGAPVVGKGATKMPIAATAKWSITNRGSIKLLSGSAVSVTGKEVKAVKAGTAEIGILDSMGKLVAKKKVTVSAFSGSYFIQSGISSKYALEITGLANGNGANAVINKKYGYAGQSFRFIKSGDYYIIKNAKSGLVLDVAGGSKDNGANVRQYESNHTGAQKWKITVDSSNRYTFVNAGSGKVLDVLGGQASAGRNVQQYKSNNTKAQKWTVSKYTAAKYAPGDYLAAACVALSGCYGAAGSKVPTNSGKNVANNMRPTGDGWTLYNKVHDKVGPNVYTKGMYSSTKYYTDCGGNVALAVGWSGIDDDYIRSCSAKQQEAYMKSSNKWDSIGTYAFKDVHSGKVNLKPGDIISINGYSHVAIYTGTTAASLKYDNATKTYYEAQLSAKEWAHLVSYSKSSTTFNVYRRNATDFNYTGSTYYKYLKSEREKYLVAGK